MNEQNYKFLIRNLRTKAYEHVEIKEATRAVDYPKSGKHVPVRKRLEPDYGGR